MPTRVDELFFDVAVKGGPQANRTIGGIVRQLRGVDKSAEGAKRQLARFSDSSAIADRSAKRLGGSLKRLVGLFGGIFVLRQIVSTMTSFETAMAEIATIADGGSEAIASMRRNILALAREVPQSPQELGAGLYQILSAGITNTSDALNVLRASSKAAVAGLTDTATAVDAVTTILNAFRLRADEATRVTDLLFETVRLGRLRFEDIATSIGAAATSASLAGVTIEELTAAMATMTLAGIDAKEATTSLNRLFLTLVNQTKEQKQAFKDLGIEFSIATVSERGFAGLMEEINKLTEGQIDQLAKLFPNIRAARSAFILAGNSLDRYNEILESTRSSSGAAERAFQIMNQTAANQARLFRNEFNIIVQEAASAVLPGLTRALSFVTNAVRSFIESVKLTAVELAVFEGRAELFAARIVAGFVGGFRDATQGFRDFLERTSAALRGISGIPGVSGSVAGLLAAGAEKAVDALDLAVDAQDRLVGNAERAVEAEEKHVRALEDARAEMVAQIDLEQGFVGERQRRQAATDAAVEGEKALARFAAANAEVLKERAQLEEELATRIADITLSAAEQQIATIERLRAKYVDLFGTIDAEAEETFRLLEERARDALRAEQAQQLVKPFRDAMAQGLAEIEFATRGIGDEEDRLEAVRRAQLGLLDDLVSQAEARLEAAELTVEQETALKKLILEITRALRTAKKGQADLGGQTKKDADQAFRDLQHVLSLIQQGVDGVLEFARAWGVVDEQLARTIKNLEQVGVGVATLIGAIAEPKLNLAGVVAGGVSILGGLSGLFGPDPEAAARQGIIEQNTRALRELGENISRLRGTFEISGADFAAALRALEQTTKGFTFLGVDIGELPATLRRLGLSMADLDRIAEELGITIRDGAGNLIPSALDDLRTQLRKVADEMIGFPDTFQGMMRRIQLGFEILDIEGPLAQFEALRGELIMLAKTGKGIPALQALLGVDVSTAEGRRLVETMIEELFRQFAAGLLTGEQLGFASPEEMLQLLGNMESLLDAIEDNTEADGGVTQSLVRTVQFTELQANELLQIEQAQLIVDEAQLSVQQDILALLESVTHSVRFTSVAAPAMFQPAGGVTINVVIGPPQFVLGDGVNIATATDLGEEAGRALVDFVNRELGELLAGRVRQLGGRL